MRWRRCLAYYSLDDTSIIWFLRCVKHLIVTKINIWNSSWLTQFKRNILFVKRMSFFFYFAVCSSLLDYWHAFTTHSIHNFASVRKERRTRKKTTTTTKICCIFNAINKISIKFSSLPIKRKSVHWNGLICRAEQAHETQWKFLILPFHNNNRGNNR